MNDRKYRITMGEKPVDNTETEEANDQVPPIDRVHLQKDNANISAVDNSNTEHLCVSGDGDGNNNGYLILDEVSDIELDTENQQKSDNGDGIVDSDIFELSTGNRSSRNCMSSSPLDQVITADDGKEINQFGTVVHRDSSSGDVVTREDNANDDYLCDLIVNNDDDDNDEDGSDI